MLSQLSYTPTKIAKHEIKTNVYLRQSENHKKTKYFFQLFGQKKGPSKGPKKVINVLEVELDKNHIQTLERIYEWP